MVFMRPHASFDKVESTPGEGSCSTDRNAGRTAERNPWRKPSIDRGAVASRSADPVPDVEDVPACSCARVLRVLERGRSMLREMGVPDGEPLPQPAEQSVPTVDCAATQNLCWRCRTRPEAKPSPLTVQRVLEGAIRQMVLPGLQARHRSGSPPARAVAGRLADRLVTPGPGIGKTVGWIESVAHSLGWSATSCAPLFEECARDLGDRFARDSCDEAQLTTALLTLQAALDAMREPLPGLPEQAPSALVVTPPDEPHRLGARLAAGTLDHAGWRTVSAEPASDAALAELVAAEHYDVLHLALSCVFRRDHRQAELARLIAHARAASRNPGITVSLGGRLFSEAPAACKTVGADTYSMSAATLPLALAGAAHRA